MTKLNYRELIEKLDQDIHKSNKNRYFIAISGPPASGKSTTSEKLHFDLTLKKHKPSILQMDGFHYDNSILKEKGLLSKKGAPETFDVYGLLNFIQTQDQEKANRVARKLRSGMVDINGAGLAPDAPFGGYKHSGIGREAGKLGLEEYLEVKAVSGWND